MLPYNREKLLPLDTCREVLGALQAEGKRVVLCHGVFDLVHPGHIVHLQEARELGDLLVVSITSEPFVNRGPGRPIFSDEMRAYALSALQCLDYVVIAPYPTALEVIDQVRPQIYCKGHEYTDAEADVTKNIGHEEARVQSFGGEIRYTGSIVYVLRCTLRERARCKPAGGARRPSSTTRNRPPTGARCSTAVLVSSTNPPRPTSWYDSCRLYAESEHPLIPRRRHHAPIGSPDAAHSADLGFVGWGAPEPTEWDKRFRGRKALRRAAGAQRDAPSIGDAEGAPFLPTSAR